MRNKAQRQYDDKKKMETPKPRILLVQFYSELLTRNENQQAKEYYDKLYRTLPGYNKFGPVWEIPVWIAEMKRNFPDADITFARNVQEVQAKQGKYTHLAFSALDCNVELIREIADGFSGSIIVGGYVDENRLTDLQNVFWFDSIEGCVEFFGTEYKTGVDYTDFAGAKTIARLTLSTGCEHRCKFCIQPDNVVKTPVADVYQQVDEIARLKSPLVYVNDKTFGQCENFWLLPLLFKRLAYDMPRFDGFIIQTTASQLLRLDDDFLLASGIKYVELGVETYNRSILVAMRKPATERTIDAATEKLRRLGIKLIPNIIVGLPGETTTTYARTLRWLSNNADAISHLNIYNLAVYDAAELADEITGNKDENRITDDIAAELFATLLYTFAVNRLGFDDKTPTSENVNDRMKRLDADVWSAGLFGETEGKACRIYQGDYPVLVLYARTNSQGEQTEQDQYVQDKATKIAQLLNNGLDFADNDVQLDATGRDADGNQREYW